MNENAIISFAFLLLSDEDGIDIGDDITAEEEETDLDARTMYTGEVRGGYTAPKGDKPAVPTTDSGVSGGAWGDKVKESYPKLG